jgi:hypothetical protein
MVRINGSIVRLTKAQICAGAMSAANPISIIRIESAHAHVFTRSVTYLFSSATDVTFAGIAGRFASSQKLSDSQTREMNPLFQNITL